MTASTSTGRTNGVGRIQIIAYQSCDGKQHQMSIYPISRTSIIDLESSLRSSENAVRRSGSGKVENPEQDSGDSRTAGAIKGGGRSSIERERYGGNYNADNAKGSVVDIDPMDISEACKRQCTDQIWT